MSLWLEREQLVPVAGKPNPLRVWVALGTFKSAGRALLGSDLPVVRETNVKRQTHE